MRKIMLMLAVMAAMMLLSQTAMAAENENPYCQIILTDQEARELELILAMEAQDEPYEGQRAGDPAEHEIRLFLHIKKRLDARRRQDRASLLRKVRDI